MSKTMPANEAHQWVIDQMRGVSKLIDAFHSLINDPDLPVADHQKAETALNDAIALFYRLNAECERITAIRQAAIDKAIASN